MGATLRLEADTYKVVLILAAIERTSVGTVLSRLAKRVLSPNWASRATPGGFSWRDRALPAPRP